MNLMAEKKKPPGGKKGTGRYNFRTVGLPEDLYFELLEFARTIERSAQWVAKKAIRRFLDQEKGRPQG